MPDEAPKLQTVVVSKNMLAIGAMVFGLVIPVITFFGATNRTSAVYGEKFITVEKRLDKLEDQTDGVDVLKAEIQAVKAVSSDNNKLLRELLLK